ELSHERRDLRDPWRAPGARHGERARFRGERDVGTPGDDPARRPGLALRRRPLIRGPSRAERALRFPHGALSIRWKSVERATTARARERDSPSRAVVEPARTRVRGALMRLSTPFAAPAGRPAALLSLLLLASPFVAPPSVALAQECDEFDE